MAPELLLGMAIGFYSEGIGFDSVLVAYRLGRLCPCVSAFTDVSNNLSDVSLGVCSRDPLVTYGGRKVTKKSFIYFKNPLHLPFL